MENNEEKNDLKPGNSANYMIIWFKQKYNEYRQTWSQST